MSRLAANAPSNSGDEALCSDGAAFNKGTIAKVDRRHELEVQWLRLAARTNALKVECTNLPAASSSSSDHFAPLST